MKMGQLIERAMKHGWTVASRGFETVYLVQKYGYEPGRKHGWYCRMIVVRRSERGVPSISVA